MSKVDTFADFEALSPESKAEYIMEQMGVKGPMDGGYPDDYLVRGDAIYIASTDHDGAPTLRCVELTQFIANHLADVRSFLEDDQ